MRPLGTVSELALCVFCQSRLQIRHLHRNLLAAERPSFRRADGPSNYIQRRNYATGRLDVQRLRTDVDQRARIGFYTLTNKQNVLHIDANTANGIFADFVHQKSKMDHGSNIQRLSKKYQVKIEDLTSLAIVTFAIPDLTDAEKKAMLPPSQHRYISGLMLQGCAQTEDPLAIVQTLSAVYLSTSSSDGNVKDIANLFPPSEIAKYRKTLEKLGQISKSLALGPDILTLQGLFLEREGKKQKAKELYQEALLRSHLKYNPKSRHPMQLKLVQPWNALGFLLKADDTLDAQVEAKNYFQKGAFEADDPLSYYELAAFEPESNTTWLQYTSKAAASGHRQAMIDLAGFYQDANAPDSPRIQSSGMRSALEWLLSWKRDGAAMLAREWLQAAGNAGHKPSLLKLVDYHEARGDRKRAIEQLREVVKPPSSANQREEWPQIVQLAKMRLAGIKT